MGNRQTKFRGVVEFQTRLIKEQKIKQHMDYITIITILAAACGFVGLAWIGGYELGQVHAAKAARKARPTVSQLVGQINNKKRITKRRAK